MWRRLSTAPLKEAERIEEKAYEHLRKIQGREFRFPGREPCVLPAWWSSIRNGVGRVFHHGSFRGQRSGKIEARSTFVVVSPTKVIFADEVLLTNEIVSSRGFPILLEFPDGNGDFATLDQVRRMYRRESLAIWNRDPLEDEFDDGVVGLRCHLHLSNGRAYLYLGLRASGWDQISNEGESDEVNLLRKQMIESAPHHLLLFQIPQSVLHFTDMLVPPSDKEKTEFGTVAQVGLRKWLHSTFHLINVESAFAVSSELDNSLPVIACGNMAVFEGDQGKRLLGRITDPAAQNLARLAFGERKFLSEGNEQRMEEVRELLELCRENGEGEFVADLQFPVSVSSPMEFDFEGNQHWSLDSWLRHLREFFRSLDHACFGDDRGTRLSHLLMDLVIHERQDVPYPYKRNRTNLVVIEGGMVQSRVDSGVLDESECVRQVNVFEGAGCAGSALFVAQTAELDASFPWLIGILLEVQDYESFKWKEKLYTQCAAFSESFLNLTDWNFSKVDSISNELQKFFFAQDDDDTLSEFEVRRKAAWKQRNYWGSDLDGRCHFLITLCFDTSFVCAEILPLAVRIPLSLSVVLPSGI